MVDRIVPATKPEDIERLAALTGVLDLLAGDARAVPAVGGRGPLRRRRPARPRGGRACSSSRDVTPVRADEAQRCLNGTHSSLAYLGYLAGHETIADTVADPAFAAFCRRLWRDEIIPTLRAAAGRGSRRLCRGAVRALRQPGDPAPDLADRHGRKPEAAAADPRDDRRRPRRRPAVAGARRSRSRPGCATSAGRTRPGAAIDVRDPLADAAEGAERRGGDPAAQGRGAARACARSFRAALAEDARLPHGGDRGLPDAGRREGARARWRGLPDDKPPAAHDMMLTRLPKARSHARHSHAAGPQPRRQRRHPDRARPAGRRGRSASGWRSPRR